MSASRRVLVALGTCVFARAASPAETWLEVKTPNFTVVSNAGEGTARKTATEFEQVRAAYAKIWRFVETAPIDPIVVLALKDEGTLKRFAPEYFEVKGGIDVVSATVYGPRRMYLLLRTDSRPANQNVTPNYNLYRAYLRAIISNAFERPMPEWLEHGAAAVLGNTSLRDKEVFIGRPVPWQLEQFRNRGRYPLQTILDTRSDSPLLDKEDERTTFDAQSYVLMHYLFFGDRGAHQPKLSRFQQLWLSGKTQDQAWAEAFGDVAEVESKLPNYANSTLLSYAQFPIEAKIDAAQFAAVPVPAVEISGLRGAVHVAMRRPVEAQAALRESRTADPSSPVSYDVEGLLADRDNDKARATEAYAQAAERGSKSAHSYYRAAQLAWKPSPDAATLALVRTRLEKAIALDPTYANAHSYLGEVLTDQGDGAAGLAAAQKAVSLDPSESYHRLAAARALDKLGRIDDARRVAEAARQLADSDSERDNAQRYLSYLGERARYQQDDASRKQARSCEAGDAAACAERAPELEAACGRNEASACLYLAVQYQNGQGLPKDLAKAAGYFERACAAGDKPSCVEHAWVILQGEGVPKDEAKGLAALDGLCADKVPTACVRVALVYLGRPRATDQAHAMDILKRACDAGDAQACATMKSIR